MRNPPQVFFCCCFFLPANASRAFLMSSALRMLLIAILAGEDNRKGRKGRKRGKPSGQGEKQGCRDRERETVLKCSRINTGVRSRNGAGNQDMREGSDGWQMDWRQFRKGVKLKAAAAGGSGGKRCRNQFIDTSCGFWRLQQTNVEITDLCFPF